MRKQQSNSETNRERQRELKKQAITKLRKWMDSGRPYGIMSVFDKRRGNNSSQDGLVKI